MKTNKPPVKSAEWQLWDRNIKLAAYELTNSMFALFDQHVPVTKERTKRTLSAAEHRFSAYKK